jgi:hypothetical protein
MNPIENVWGWIKQKLSKLYAKPKDLKEILTRLWLEIVPDSIKRLYRSMNKRIQALKDVNINSIKGR